MTTGGWIVLISSLLSVTALTAYCIFKLIQTHQQAKDKDNLP